MKGYFRTFVPVVSACKLMTAPVPRNLQLVPQGCSISSKDYWNLTFKDKSPHHLRSLRSKQPRSPFLSTLSVFQSNLWPPPKSCWSLLNHVHVTRMSNCQCKHWPAWQVISRTLTEAIFFFFFFLFPIFSRINFDSLLEGRNHEPLNETWTTRHQWWTSNYPRDWKPVSSKWAIMGNVRLVITTESPPSSLLGLKDSTYI